MSTEEQKANSLAYYHQHKDRLNRNRKKWRDANKEHIREYDRSYYKKNKAKLKALRDSPEGKAKRLAFYKDNKDRLKAKRDTPEGKAKQRAYNKRWLAAHPDYLKKWRKGHKKKRTKLYNRIQYLKHRERRLKYQKEYRKKNKLKIKQWKLANYERLAEYCKRWKRANKDKIKMYRAKRTNAK